LKKYDAVMDEFRSDMSATKTWAHVTYPHLSKHTVAYFSMEFAIHSSLRLYAGGLGVLAGDFCKEASDLGLSLIGVGFMYPQGYFYQHISPIGWQEEIYRELNFAESPITPVLDGKKRPVKVEVELDSRSVHLAVCQVNVGRVKLYLLDSNLPENCPCDRQLTARLYGGDREVRIQQEIVLGIGGVRVLRALGIQPSIWHANEGHTCFMMLERCREMVAEGIHFNEATDRVRATTVFTTHTPVPAGNDCFNENLVDKYFQRYWGALGLERDAFLKLGRQESCADFNMTVLGLRMAQHCNGVSKLHGAVCRRMWQSLWPGVEERDVPICSITNGVHVPTWVAPQMSRLYEKYIDQDWFSRHDDPAIWERVLDIPDEEIWRARRWLKQKLISVIQDHARKHWLDNEGAPLQVLAMGALLDTDALTIGFCRRFTDYKRAALILSDLTWLKRILQDELRPVQIVFAGKAHPNDEHGKHLLQEIYNLARNPVFGGRIAFVEDYDLHMARYFVHGVDVWLNTPRPLQEASGTSGMKAALNGVPHLSSLDGWWYEGFTGNNGWSIHNDISALSMPDQERMDAETLYHILGEKVIPLYYDRDLNGVPHGWLKVVRQAIRSSMPTFCARRMAKEYAEQMYLEAAQAAETAMADEPGFLPGAAVAGKRP
ncbi:MAG: alpha-glucan family phosphorylase, partial [Dehalococcoidia bacterium]|nr:alpha-glucan family phosphorylase [Dehalococcoidia bacterium]